MPKVSLITNVPQQLSLAEVAGELDERNNVHYATTCGQTLTLSYTAAIRLNALDLKPGDPFVICKLVREGMIFYDIRLAGQSERRRAADEAPELEAQLTESIRRVKQAKSAAAPPAPAVPPIPTNGAGVDRKPEPVTPSPVKTCKPSTASARVSYRDALKDITSAVLDTLKERGEQWADGAKQDLVSTVFIAAGKTGQIVFDFMGDSGKDVAA